MNTPSPRQPLPPITPKKKYHPDPSSYTIDDIRRDIDFIEMDYRRFKQDVFTKMRMFEEVIREQKLLLRLKLEAEFK